MPQEERTPKTEVLIVEKPERGIVIYDENIQAERIMTGKAVKL